jgi:5-methylcytosine-specific restriction endonuclease McrA
LFSQTPKTTQIVLPSPVGCGKAGVRTAAKLPALRSGGIASIAFSTLMPTRFTAARAWALAEDWLFPALDLGPHARALYYHLLRATHLRRSTALRITTRQLARATAQSTTTVRVHLRRLERAACLRIHARTRLGLKITVRTPEEILRRGELQLVISTHEEQMAVLRPPLQGRHANPVKVPARRKTIFRRDRGRCFGCSDKNRRRESSTHVSVGCGGCPALPTPSGERVGRSPNPFKNPALRRKIFRRDGGRCFYCLRVFGADDWTLDHVVSRAAGGTDDESNAVAACAECNVDKGTMRADDFLRALFRRQRLTSAELHGRLRALRTLRKEHR